MSWQFSEGADPGNGGRMTARLDHGVPETDNIQARGVCEARADGGAPSVTLTLGADIGDLNNGEETELRFSGGGFDHSIGGEVTGRGAEVGLTGVVLEIGADDALWEALTEKDALDYNVPGYSSARLELGGGHRQIGYFIEACRSYADETPKKVAQADTQSDKGETKTASGGVPEKEAFEAAKELGTIEAWEAFLENFPEGFRADLARAYVQRLGRGAPGTDTASGGKEYETASGKDAPEPPAPADISLAMTSQGACEGGRNCSVTVTATNTGGEPFSGDLTIATSLAPGGAELQGTGTPPFSCEGAGGGAICSTGLANIAPGQSATIPMTFTLPRNAGGQVTTCASVAWGGVPAALQPADVQRKLNELGFDAGPVDGQPGRQTVAAIKAFQQSAGMRDTGEIDLPLLLALFAPGGEGDANPLNDQACAGAAVTQAPPLPAAYQPPSRPSCPLGQIVASNGTCGCPSSAPFWTGRSCVPRLARNCKGGTYYNKNQKLCLCPSSKPYWYNNRCHAQFDNCPGDSVRVGDKCLKENDPGFAARPRPSGPPLQALCKRNSIRIGNVCVNFQNAPVFGGRPGRGGGGRGPRGNASAGSCPGDSVRNAQGNCVKENDAGPGGVPNNFFYGVPNQAAPGGGQNTTLQNRYNTTGAPIKPTAGWRDSKQLQNGGRLNQQQNKLPPPVVKQVRPQQPSGNFTFQNRYNTPGATKQPPNAGQGVWRDSKQPASPPPSPGIKCGAGMVAQGNKCVSVQKPGSTTSKEIFCQPGTGLVPQNGKCGCPPGQQWNGKVCAAPQPQQKKVKLKQKNNNKNQAAPAAKGCKGGQIRQANGNCTCPSGQNYVGGRCIALNQLFGGGNQNQGQQQQPQRQQQLSPQQQQQLNQGLQNIQKGLQGLISDRRLKRDIELVATRADGLKLYSFRYLWSDTAYVGVMAQQLLAGPATREAVSLHENGYYMVDYARLGLRMSTLAEWRARGLSATDQPLAR